MCMCGFHSQAKINSLYFSGKFAGTFEKRKIYAYIVSGLNVFQQKYTKKLLRQPLEQRHTQGSLQHAVHT